MNAVEIAKKYIRSLETKKMNKKIPLIVDCNPGIDDALALMLLSDNLDKFDVKLITSCAGNTPIDITTNNIQFFAKHFFPGVKVAKGSRTALVKNHVLNPSDINGPDGLGKYNIGEQDYPVLQNAVEEIANVLTESDEAVTIVTLGPLTNIAKVAILYPELKQKIACIYSMIGSIDGTGNITDFSELNSYFDPEAFDLITKSGIKLIVNPMQVGNETRILKSSFERMSEVSIRDSLVKTLAQSLNDTENYVCLHDVNTIVALSKPEFYEFVPCNIDVYTIPEIGGKTEIVEDEDGNNFVQKVKDAAELKKYILKALFKKVD